MAKHRKPRKRLSQTRTHATKKASARKNRPTKAKVRPAKKPSLPKKKRPKSIGPKSGGRYQPKKPLVPTVSRVEQAKQSLNYLVTKQKPAKIAGLLGVPSSRVILWLTKGVPKTFHTKVVALAVAARSSHLRRVRKQDQRLKELLVKQAKKRPLRRPGRRLVFETKGASGSAFRDSPNRLLATIPREKLVERIRRVVKEAFERGESNKVFVRFTFDTYGGKGFHPFYPGKDIVEPDRRTVHRYTINTPVWDSVDGVMSHANDRIDYVYLVDQQRSPLFLQHIDAISFTRKDNK